MKVQSNKKTVYEGLYEDVLFVKDHYYLISKKNKICILPFTISAEGVLDQLGVIKQYSDINEDYDYTLINGYVSTDDGTGLVCANRLLFNVIGKNIETADSWIYLGKLYNNLSLDNSSITIYGVNVSNMSIKVQESESDIKFEMLDCARVIDSENSLFLSGYLRLFQYVYVNSLGVK